MLRMVCFRSCIMFSSLNNYRKEPSRDATVCLEITVATRRKTVYNAQLLSEFSTYISQRFWTLTKAMTTGSPQMDWQRQVVQKWSKIKANPSNCVLLHSGFLLSYARHVELGVGTHGTEGRTIWKNFLFLDFCQCMNCFISTDFGTESDGICDDYSFGTFLVWWRCAPSGS